MAGRRSLILVFCIAEICWGQLSQYGKLIDNLYNEHAANTHSILTVDLISTGCRMLKTNHGNHEIGPRLEGVATINECQEHCRQHPDCLLATYDKGNKWCWIKSNVGPATSDSQWTTIFMTCRELKQLMHIFHILSGSKLQNVFRSNFRSSSDTIKQSLKKPSASYF